MTVNTKPLSMILKASGTDHVPLLQNGRRLQILKSVRDLPMCQIHHFAAFIEDIGMLVVWDDVPNHLLQRVSDVEAQLLAMAWGNPVDKLAEDTDIDKKDYTTTVVEQVDGESMDLEAAGLEVRRSTFLVHAMVVSTTLILILAALGAGWRNIAIEISTDSTIGIPRLGLIALAPMQIFLALVSRSTP